MKNDKVVDIRFERAKRMSSEEIAKKMMQDPELLKKLFDFKGEEKHEKK